MADETETYTGVKTAELKGKDDQELVDMLKTLKGKLFASRFENYTNKLNDTARLGKVRREIARIHTIQTERRIAAKPAVAAKPAPAPVAAKPAEAPAAAPKKTKKAPEAAPVAAAAAPTEPGAAKSKKAPAKSKKAPAATKGEG